MIKANNPDIDAAVLELRIQQELEHPERSLPPALAASSGVRSINRSLDGMRLKLRMRAIPMLGPVLVLFNRLQRRYRLIARLLAMPGIGYALRWMKSLLLVHETRGLLHQTRDLLHVTQIQAERAWQEAGFVENRLRDQLSLQQQEAGFMEKRLKTELELATSLLAALRREVDEEKRQIATNRAEILFQQRRMNNLIEQGMQTPAASGEARAVAAAAAPGDELDAYYAAFEAAFRGSREEIRARLEFYLDRVKAAPANLPVLDIGCGRGEWIELLGDGGITAYGIDLNSVFVADAQESRLDVRHAEALSHLRGLGEASLAGVTGFHIIEHLEVDHLIRIIDEANRVIAPGGFLLFETPNPENLIVGASSFWNDPTHRSPLPSSVVRFMIEQRGFLNPEVINLHPADEKLKLAGSDEVVVRLNQLLYGAQDYAIWARKA
jgi:SAM-dependent methyltransferase